MSGVILIIVALLLLIVVFPVTLTVLGRINEKKHLESLAMRENANRDFMLSTLPKPTAGDAGITGSEFVSGSAVIASDILKDGFFKYVMFFGGESKGYTRMYSRAHREAVQRMIEQAKAKGYNAICNIRFDSTDITGAASQNAADSKRKSPMRVATCIVSGTAYRR